MTKVSVDGKDSKRIALVIGSGAVKCSAAFGLWKALSRAGIQVDLFVGCSGGSLFAGMMALNYELEDCIEKTRQLWDGRVTQKRNWPSLLKAALPQLFKFDARFGMMDGARMLAGLKSVFGERSFAEALAPLYIIATDFYNGEPVVISEGLLRDALRASIAIPYIWPAWPLGERLLVDGSLSNPMPVDVAIREGADIILAMGFESPYPHRINSVSRYAFHINSVMTNNLFKANYAFHNLAHHAEIIPILPEFNREIRLFDTVQIPYVIEQGERAAEEQIPYLQRLLSTAAV